MSGYRAALAFGAALLTSAPALAQQAADHSAHHPEAAASPQAQAATPANQQGGMMMCHEMMGRMAGTMGQGHGMMGQAGQGMMGSGMMGSGMMGSGMMGGGAMMGGTTGRHVEGRLAFLKAELKIADAQAAQWAAFADAVRANAKAAAETRHATAPGQAASETLPERLAQQENALTATLIGFKKVQETLGKLYAVLSADQKKQADGMVIGLIGTPTCNLG